MADVRKTVITDFRAETKGYTKNVDKATKSNVKMEESTEEMQGAMDSMNDTLNSTLASLGIMPAASTKVTRGIGMMSKGLKGFKLALIATGIGAFIVALGALTAFFKSSEKGQNALNKIMRVSGVIMGNLSDVVANLGEMIFNAFSKPKETIVAIGNAIKTNITNRFEALALLGPAIAKIFSGKFKEGFTEIGDAALQLGTGVENLRDKMVQGYEDATAAAKAFADEMAREIQLGQDLADLEAETDRLQREFWVEQSAQAAVIADMRLKARQEEQFSAADRLKFINEARRLTEELAKDELVIAQNRLKERQLENSFSKSTKENLNEEARLEAEVNNIIARRAQMQKGLEREATTIRKQAQADVDAAKKAEEDAAQAELDRIESEKQAIIDSQKEIDAMFEESTNQAIELSIRKEKRIRDEEKKSEVQRIKIFQAQVQREQERENMVIALFNLGKELARESEALSLALDTAQVIRNSIKAISNAWAMPDPNIFTKIATVATVAASVLPLIGRVKSVVASFEEGGEIPRETGGMIKGRGHVHGGVKFDIGGEAQGGEFIVNREATSRNLPLLQKINAFGKYAVGGLVGDTITADSRNLMALDQVRNAALNQRYILVTEDLTDVQNRVDVTESRATL